MILSNSPRKAVPLALGDDWEQLGSTSKVASNTRRVFFCGVVVEGEDGKAISDDVQELVASLGDPLNSHSDSETVRSRSENRNNNNDATMYSSSAIEDILDEFVTTERSYVKRLRTLKHDYADPLRTFARSKDTAIISLYDANTLFGNIDNLLPVNEALLADLEKMLSPEGPQTVGFIGDVILRHFKDSHGFEQYKQYYVKREEAQSIFEREMSKRSSGFAAFVDRIKYSSADTKNRIGLRELLMDPVQRIPRYTLMLRTMIKRMPSCDPQRVKLAEAVEIASKIALAEIDEETRRASVMFCLRTTIDGFPPGLISHSRRLVDHIDVEDTFIEGLPSASANTGSSALEPLHCTLFLFNDKLMIVKRPGNGEKSGQVLAGLDQLEKIAKGSGVPSGLKKNGMSCKGIIDLTDVVATDVGGADFHLYLEKSPQDQTDRWSGRPFRPLSVVFPPHPPNFNPQRTETEKARFLENLWLSQANIRAHSGKSVVLRSEEREVESRGGRTTYARTYFNVYQRTPFLQEPRKTKVVVHIDEFGTSDPIPFGINGPPFVSIRVQPMAGALSRYKVTSSDPSDENEEDIVQTGRVSDRIIHTIHQYGLFKFRTGKNSVPSTPTASSRSRAAIFGLDAISRNLFNAFPGTSRGDIFGGSMNGSRRSKSSASRSSVSAQSSSDASFARFSQRSTSTITAATSISSIEDDKLHGVRPSRSKSRAHRLLGRSRSPKGSGSEAEVSPKRRISRSGSISNSFSREQSPSVDVDEEYDTGDVAPERCDMDESEWDLTMRLELARHNSQNQRSKGSVEPPWDGQVEETIYEDSPPEPIRPSSRASGSGLSQRSTTPTNRPLRSSYTEVNEHSERAASRNNSGSRPRGPRSPSPMPSSLRVSPEPDFENLDSALESTLLNLSHRPVTPPEPVSPLPRSRRQPFEPTGNTETVRKSIPHGGQKTPNAIEPLSIKKKSSLRNSTGESPPSRKAQPRTPSNIRERVVSPRRASPIVRQKKAPTSSNLPQKDIDLPRLLRHIESIKDELETSRRAVKRIKLDSEQLLSTWAQPPDTEDNLPRLHKLKGLHPTTQSSVAMSRAAQERMEEMRQLISKRGGEVAPRYRGLTEGDTTGSDAVRGGELLRFIEEAASEADMSLLRAASSQEALAVDLSLLAADLKEGGLFERSRVESQSTKWQYELAKHLFVDTTGESDIMALTACLNDVSLPGTDAWTTTTRDLRQSKESRNALSKENSQLKRRLEELESEKEEWAALLRRHGLIS
ncbi:hypothetical protein B0F90DRAFT_1807884 [Multifurca ochricompacta]|uniref:DH domain-containing protein n=1 Tax=Multifurca ochricompacta TaxID=376703 RepID=A0AAD4QT20_9AGAM|nr:hypothetical protein B0F90DRAFT_1807884 [Multifurca ochricompacta]